jgi:hypothetical protein
MLFWSEEELEEVSETTAYHMTQLLKRTLSSDWENIHQPLKEVIVCH